MFPPPSHFVIVVKQLNTSKHHHHHHHGSHFSHGTFLYFSWYLENSVYLVVLFLEIKNFAFGAVNHQQLRLVLGLDFFFFFSQLRFFPRTDSGIRPNTQNLNWKKKKKNPNPNPNLNCWWLIALKGKFLEHLHFSKKVPPNIHVFQVPWKIQKSTTGKTFLRYDFSYYSIWRQLLSCLIG